MILLLACTEALDPVDPGSAPPSDTASADAPTWHADIAPLVAEHCAGCHSSGGIAPFPLDSYASAAPMAGAMADATASGEMPPWGAVETDECTPRAGWQNDARLDGDERDLLAAWADAGAPEGDPDAAAALPDPPDLGLADADVEWTAPIPYTTAGDKDELVCLTIDPGLTQNIWVTGLEVVPGDLSVVHHVVVWTDPHGESAALAGEDGYYDCFGGPGVSDATTLAVWVPGAFPTTPPAGSGFPVAAGSRVVMQMHYHPAGSTGTSDATGFRASYVTEKPAKSAYLTGVGNAYSAATGLLADPDDRRRPEFRIPANASAHTETMEIDFADVEGRYDVWAAEVHMHMVGVDMLATVEHTDPEVGVEEECLIHEPAWDFDWQRLYLYDSDSISLGQGDIVRLRCTYDNTMENPGVVRALEDAGLSEPTDVYLGETSYDEMCILIFGVTY